jgi:hypothetical protein
MNSIRTCAALPALMLLAACGEATDADAPPNPTEPVEVADISRDLPDVDEVAPPVGTIDAGCRAQLAEPFVGETLDLGTRTTLLDAVEPQAIVRFIEPGDEIEGDDNNADRLNIRTNEAEEITEVFCG